MPKRNNFELIEKEKVNSWFYEYYDEVLKIIRSDNINNISDEDYTFFGKRASDGNFMTKKVVWAMLHCEMCKNNYLHHRLNCKYCEFDFMWY